MAPGMTQFPILPLSLVLLLASACHVDAPGSSPYDDAMAEDESDESDESDDELDDEDIPPDVPQSGDDSDSPDPDDIPAEDPLPPFANRLAAAKVLINDHVITVWPLDGQGNTLGHVVLVDGGPSLGLISAYYGEGTMVVTVDDERLNTDRHGTLVDADMVLRADILAEILELGGLDETEKCGAHVLDGLRICVETADRIVCEAYLRETACACMLHPKGVCQ